MKILIFGGTTEGRLLAETLTREGYAVTVSCATELGVEELQKIDCEKLCGRLNSEQMTALVREFNLVADATHPYAAEVTANVRKACKVTAIPYCRILRQAGEAPDCVQVKSCREAAEYLKSVTGNVLITTGSKELEVFGILPPERIFARVLPTHAALDTCERMKLPHRNILALQGPFSRKLNEAMLEQYQISWIVTKNSGKPGGFDEKLQAAQNLGVGVVLVERPEDSGVSMEEFLEEVKKKCLSV